MNIEKALDEIRTYIQEIVHLRELAPKNQEYEVWRHKVRTFLKAVFGNDSEEYKSFPTHGMALKYAYFGGQGEVEHDYQEGLTWCETALKDILVKHETLRKHGFPDAARAVVVEPPEVFIAHGGESQALTKLKEYLVDLGVKPLIVEKVASESRSVNEQVGYNLALADCAVVLGTADDKNLRDGKLYPRDNVAIEIGRLQERFPKRTVFLLEEGASLPSNISEKVYEHFTQDNMEKAFAKVARELIAFGVLKAIKPQGKAPNA